MTRPVVSVQIDGQWRTPKTSGVTWTRSAPGGCMNAEFAIDDPLIAERAVPDTRVLVSAADTGRVLFDGDVRDPGARTRKGKRSGQVAVAGSVARLADRKWKLPYVVRGPGAWVDEDINKFEGGNYWVRGVVTQESAISGDGSTRESLMLRANSPWQFGWMARARCTAFDEADLTIGAMRYTESASHIPADAVEWRTQITVGPLGFGGLPVDHNPGYYALQSIFAGVTPNFASGQSELRVSLQYKELPAKSAAGLSWWAAYSDLSVVGARKLMNGTNAPLTSSSQATTEQIVADVVGRSGCIDPDLASVQIGSAIINDLNFSEPVPLTEVLNRLLAFERSYRWQILPSADTLHPFEWGPWPTTPRYSLSQSRGTYTETIREDEVYNRVVVRFQENRGRWRQAVAVADPDVYPYVRLLTDAGRTRDFMVDLDTGGSRPNAEAVAAALLPDLASLKVSATFGTTQTVYDIEQGVYVHPFEVEPGYLAVVEDTGEVMRITQTVCDGDAGSTNLTLGTPARTAEELLASMKQPRRN